jgi:hypothetical protein
MCTENSKFCTNILIIIIIIYTEKLNDSGK